MVLMISEALNVIVSPAADRLAKVRITAIGAQIVINRFIEFPPKYVTHFVLLFPALPPDSLFVVHIVYPVLLIFLLSAEHWHGRFTLRIS
jgi:hypothetical protein